MRKGFWVSTEFSFLVAGVAIMAMAWGANLSGVLSGSGGDSHGGLDVYFWFLFMLQGIAFAAVGAAYDNHRRMMTDPAFAKRYVVGYLFLLDGALHLLAFNQHLFSSTLAALFFEVVAPVQIVGGILLPHIGPRFDLAWLFFTLFLIGVYVVSRTVPIWPIGAVEELDALGILSKLVEVGAVVGLVSLLRGERAARGASAAGASAANSR
jgi:hypothetical protein